MKFKQDKFRRSRGGYSRALSVSCAKCGHTLFKYQKDGPGILKRLYIDRIIDASVSGKSNLICKKCAEILGTPMVYKKESRPALRLFAGAVSKKIVALK